MVHWCLKVYFCIAFYSVQSSGEAGLEKQRESRAKAGRWCEGMRMQVGGKQKKSQHTVGFNSLHPAGSRTHSPKPLKPLSSSQPSTFQLVDILLQNFLLVQLLLNSSFSWIVDLQKTAISRITASLGGQHSDEKHEPLVICRWSCCKSSEFTQQVEV